MELQFWQGGVMDKAVIWFGIFCKRQVKRPFFMILLVMIPLLAYGIGKLEQKDESGISIAVCVQEEGLAEEIAAILYKKEGAFSFYSSENKEELMNDVASRKAECGFVFAEEFEEKLDRGNFKRSITIYTAPSTVLSSLASEVVYSALIQQYGKNILVNFVRNSEIFEIINLEGNEGRSEMLYDQYYSDGSTFSFAFEEFRTGTELETKKKATFPVRGIVAVYLLVVGAFAGVSLCMDEANGLFVTLKCRERHFCALASMLAPVSMAACSGLAALWVTGNMRGVLREITVIVIYSAVIVLVSYLWKKIVGNAVILCSLIPFWAIGSLIFSPVFLEIDMWIPGAEILSRAFLPFYYLQYWS